MLKRLALALIAALSAARAAEVGAPVWNPAAAGAYLDERAAWWSVWQSSARDHGTFCISCHTTLPIALARPALRGVLGEKTASPAEQRVLDNLVKRVRMWKDAEPFYPDQLRGLPKTSESRATEAIINALVLVWRDAPAGALSADAKTALDNLWPLQFQAGDMKGSWAWLQFYNAPWEGDSQFWGNTLAAIAIGTAPGNYKAEPSLQSGIASLRTWLRREMARQRPIDKAALLWASAKLPELLSPAEQKAIVDDVLSRQRPDGGFSTATLVGDWKRKDGTALDTSGDGYATGLVAFALEQIGDAAPKPALRRALEWLARNQNAADGRWPASSLNKDRPLESDAGRFMSDAATAYAVLALENAPR